MSEQALSELLQTVAPYAFVLVLGFVFRSTIREKIFPNVASIEGFGFKIGRVAKKLDEAVEEHGGGSGASPLAPAPAERLLVLRRAQRLARLLQGARLLWIDPNPRGNRYEIELLRSLGIGIDLARCSEEADELLKALRYDVVVSNIKRVGTVDGVTSLATLRDELDKEGRHLPPVVWYVATVDPKIARLSRWGSRTVLISCCTTCSTRSSAHEVDSDTLSGLNVSSARWRFEGR